MASPKRLLIVSNGHGEDMVGRMLAQRVRELAGERVEVVAFPLVGTGETYRRAGIRVIGPQRELPSGGFIYLSLGHLLRDLAAGWLGLVLKQLRFAWHHRKEFDGIIGVGDRVSLELNLYVFRKPMVWVGIAYSARPLPPGKRLGNPRMWRAMREWCTDIFVRDPETAALFRGMGIHAEYVGNPMMDGVAVDSRVLMQVERALRAAGWDGQKAVVGLLPGSRRDALLNLPDQLQALRRLYEMTRGGVQGVVAWASALGMQALGEALASSGWRLKPLDDGDGEDCYVAVPGDGRGDGPTVAVLPGRFAAVVQLCSLVIGQAGTAVEQAAGLGKPVVTFESRGVQVTRRFLAGQKKLLGDALAVVDPDPEVVAREAAAILRDPERLRAMGEAGRRLMGPPGATKAIAQRIVERFLPDTQTPTRSFAGAVVADGDGHSPVVRDGSGAAKSGVRLSVIVVTYRTRELLRGFLESASREMASLTGVTGRIVVVDNASQDGTREMVAEEFPGAVFIENEKNLGPAAAFNRGLQRALPDSDLILLSNSDIAIHRGTLKKMVDYLLAHPELDGCNGRLFNPDGTPQRTRTHIVHLLPERADRSRRATFPGTTFALYRRYAFKRVGGFDETFFFYNEDLDWAERARKARLRFAYLADATVTHFKGAGRQLNQSSIRRDLYRANLYYFRKHHPALAPLVYWGQRLQLARQMRQCARLLRRADADPSERERLTQQLIDLEEAYQRLETEWMRPSQPRVPELGSKPSGASVAGLDDRKGCKAALTSV